MNLETKITLGRRLHRWEQSILEEGNLFLVGGIVRDLLRGAGMENVDVDYVSTGLSLERLMELLADFGTPNLVGRSFGVIKFVTLEGTTVDVALPRTESSTGPGHRAFDVRFDPGIPLETDLRRRDYTINSMALELGTMRLVDPLGGREDLAGRILRVNRDTSFIEDPLRILRGVQFMARFGLSVDPETKKLIERERDLVATVSLERVRDELNKLLVLAEHPGAGLVFMHETGILPLLLPELDETWDVEQNEHHPEDVFHHSIRCCDLTRRDAALRWTALLHDLGKKAMKVELGGRIVFHGHEGESARIARRILTRLVFPAAFVEHVEHLVAQHMFLITPEWSDAAVRRFVARVGCQNIEDLLELRIADGTARGDQEIKAEVEYACARIASVRQGETAFSREDLAVDGHDVMKIACLRQGPEVGRILDRLLDEVLEHPEYNTREKLLAMIPECADSEGK